MFGLGKNASRKKALAQIQSMTGGDWLCAGCGQIHTGLSDLAIDRPLADDVPKEVEHNSALRMDGDFLSEDFCVIRGEHFMIRTVLRIPVIGLPHDFGFGVWSSLSKSNFELYVEHFDDGFPEDEDIHWTSWFMTGLSYFEKAHLEQTWVIPQPNRQRPLVRFMDEENRITTLQNEGMEPTELLKIYAHYGCVLSDQT